MCSDVTGKELEHPSYRRAGTAQPREEKAQGQGMDLINVCKYLIGRRSGEERARLLSVVPTDWTRVYEHKLNPFPI